MENICQGERGGAVWAACLSNCELQLTLLTWSCPISRQDVSLDRGKWWSRVTAHIALPNKSSLRTGSFTPCQDPSGISSKSPTEVCGVLPGSARC